ncbi:hypothetical protein NP233_g12477 [Leucocoprinus birnbaumii]|uniref:Uncharacterized protein n=1 Tax=Leucocoprinus birnbaumii TaxID=56174 RepID=A0AAD5YN16_9AGAR|nr:hypothetical protein NP233_g12477 [Leucocoprinus birnbaumii]
MRPLRCNLVSTAFIMGRHGAKKSQRTAVDALTASGNSKAASGKITDSAIKALLTSVEADLEACGLLAVATTGGLRDEFCNHIRTHHIPRDFPEFPNNFDLFHAFTTWAGSLGSIHNIPARNIPAALAYRAREKLHHRWSKENFIETAGINWKAVDKDKFLASIPQRVVTPLPRDQPYPPPDAWIAETEDIASMNHKFINVEDLHDRRDCRRPIKFLDPGQLQLDIGPGESVMIQDGSDGSFVGLVIRDVCGNADAIQFVDKAVSEAVEMRVSSRKGDVGHLPQVGLSAGSRSAMQLDYVKNLKRKPQSQDAKEEADRNLACAFCLSWNLTRAIAPGEVLDDFDEFLSGLQICRMDGGGTMPHDVETGQGNYTVTIPNFTFTFHGAEFAPPTAVCALDYSRYVHYERQPHKYSVSWTTARSLEPSASDLDNGGHFFIASHGIRIQAAANTMIIWKPELWHGTSLSLQDPKSLITGYRQRGLAFVTSSRLPKAWARYSTGQLTKEAAEEWLLEHVPLSPEEDTELPPGGALNSPKSDGEIDKLLESDWHQECAGKSGPQLRRSKRTTQLPKHLRND